MPLFWWLISLTLSEMKYFEKLISVGRPFLSRVTTYRGMPRHPICPLIYCNSFLSGSLFTWHKSLEQLSAAVKGSGCCEAFIYTAGILIPTGVGGEIQYHTSAILLFQQKLSWYWMSEIGMWLWITLEIKHGFCSEENIASWPAVFSFIWPEILSVYWGWNWSMYCELCSK